MTSPYLVNDIKRDEGCRLEAYPDPLSHAEPYTIGYGHTGGIKPGEKWTQEQADDALANDIAKVKAELTQHLSWWQEDLDDLRQDVLVNMGFNMGVPGLMKFVNTLSSIRAHEWQRAHDGMLQSAWARQVGRRAQRLAQQMLTGEHQA